MFCKHCGKRVEDNAKFCDGCGAKLIEEEVNASPIKEAPIKEVNILKCPCCGSTIPSDALQCPCCGSEINKENVSQSVQSFFEHLTSITDEDRKMEVIKTFPIPTNRADIKEFMFLASSNFDVKYYVSHMRKDSIASAWLAKIDQCCKKAEYVFAGSPEIESVKKIRDDIHKKIKTQLIIKISLIVGGIILAVGGTLGIYFLKEAPTGVMFAMMAIAAAGVVCIVLGSKKKKTNKELREEKEEELRKKANKK